MMSLVAFVWALVVCVVLGCAFRWCWGVGYVVGVCRWSACVCVCEDVVSCACVLDSRCLPVGVEAYVPDRVLLCGECVLFVLCARRMAYDVRILHTVDVLKRRT